MRARYYSPEIGRFLSLDPVLGSIADSQSLNRYAFCADDPINSIDPEGTDAVGVLTFSWGTFGTLAVADGPLPVGDVIGAIIAAGGTVIAGGILIYENIDAISDGANKLKDLVLEAARNALPKSAEKDNDNTRDCDSGTEKPESDKNATDSELNFSNKAAQHMSEAGRYVPIQILKEAIEYGKASADPRGSNAIMYTIQMFKNGKEYTLEVLYDIVSKTIWHFMYR